MTYSMQCSCGHVMSVDATSREEAVAKLKEIMNQEALDEHMRQYHKPEEQKPTLEQAHMMIEQTLREGTIAGAQA